MEGASSVSWAGLSLNLADLVSRGFHAHLLQMCTQGYLSLMQICKSETTTSDVKFAQGNQTSGNYTCTQGL